MKALYRSKSLQDVVLGCRSRGSETTISQHAMPPLRQRYGRAATTDLTRHFRLDRNRYIVCNTRGAGASARYSRAAATPKALRRCQVVELSEDEE